MTKKELKRKLNVIIDQLTSLETDLAQTCHYDKSANEKIMDWFNRIYVANNSLVRIVKDEI